MSGSGEVELGENEYISLDETEPRGIRSLEDLVVLAIRDWIIESKPTINFNPSGRTIQGFEKGQ